MLPDCECQASIHGIRRESRTSTSWARLPVGPLVAHVAARGGLAACLAREPGLDRVRLERALLRGVTVGVLTYRAANILAVELLGLHPMLVWGDD